MYCMRQSAIVTSSVSKNVEQAISLHLLTIPAHYRILSVESVCMFNVMKTTINLNFIYRAVHTHTDTVSITNPII
jgi:hypothetical protein